MRNNDQKGGHFSAVNDQIEKLMAAGEVKVA